jgi:hypothetical protein
MECSYVKYSTIRLAAPPAVKTPAGIVPGEKMPPSGPGLVPRRNAPKSFPEDVDWDWPVSGSLLAHLRERSATERAGAFAGDSVGIMRSFMEKLAFIFSNDIEIESISNRGLKGAEALARG